ncbi:hypothetical protein ACP4OV_000227 [Aristida adscensionis]
MAGTRTVLLDVGLGLAFTVHVLVVIWVLRRGFRARARRSRVAEEQEGGAAAEGLSAEELGELPCHELKEEVAVAGGGSGECAVCLEAFRAGDRRRVLPRCGHGFHAACVDSWLRKSRRCPVCRAEVVASPAAAQRKDAPVVDEGPATLEIVTPR